MMVSWVILLCLGVGLINGENEEALLKKAVNELKDSGALADMEKKLEETLFRENLTEDKGGEEDKMLVSFIEEYLEEKKLSKSLTKDTVLKLLGKVDKKSLTPMSYVKLGSLMETTATLLSTGSKLQDLLSKVASYKNLELINKVLENVKKDKKQQPPPTPKQNPQLIAMELMGMFMSGNVHQEGIFKALNFFKSEPGFVVDQLINILGQFGLVGKDTVQIVKGNIVPLLSSPPAFKYVESFYNMTMYFFQSTSGQRMIKAVPLLMKEPTADNAMKLLQKEAEWNWDKFFVSMQNSDYKVDFLHTCASFLVKSFNYCYSHITDPTSNMMMNGMLISQGLPPFDFQNPFKSLTALINKAIKLFSVMKLDVTQYMDVVESMYKDFSETQSTKDFMELNNEEKIRFVERFLEDEIMEPIQVTWRIQSYMSDNNKWDCTDRLLCVINAKMAKSKSEYKIATTKAMSIALSWFWSGREASEEFWSRFEAIKTGSSSKNCDEHYKSKIKECLAFDWQKSDKMELNYDKIEL